jgi:hypothetical protein
VVAEHGEGGHVARQRRQAAGDGLRWHHRAAHHSLNDEVAGEQHEVRPQADDGRDDRRQLADAVVRRADVEVAGDRHPQAVAAARPARQRQLVAAGSEPPGLPENGPGGEQGGDGEQRHQHAPCDAEAAPVTGEAARGIGWPGGRRVHRSLPWRGR